MSLPKLSRLPAAYTSSYSSSKGTSRTAGRDLEVEHTAGCMDLRGAPSNRARAGELDSWRWIMNERDVAGDLQSTVSAVLGYRTEEKDMDAHVHLRLLPLPVPLAAAILPTAQFHDHIIIPHPLTANDLLTIDILLPPHQHQTRRIASLVFHPPALARAPPYPYPCPPKTRCEDKAGRRGVLRRLA